MLGGMMVVRTIIRRKGQITIPEVIRRALHLDEGDPVDIEVRGGVIVLRPRKVVEASQAWFWSREWQAGEREASEDLAKGRSTFYDTDEEFLSSLS
jgi:AbrB family looped-hinge helix DNA binding protein